MRVLVALLALAACSLLVVFSAQATPLLDLTISHFPRVYATDVHVKYVADGASVDANLLAGQGLLTVEGTPWTLYEEGGPEEGVDINEGVFSIRAVIDRATTAAVGGQMEITGDPVMVDSGDPYSGVLRGLFYSTTFKLLPGGTPAFGAGGNDTLDFIFVQEGTPSLAPESASVGIKIYGESVPDSLFSEANPPTFQVDFENLSDGSGNAFYLPEPASLSVLALGAIALLRRRR
jgi:MYXO-CTERM domain-containing protein